MADARPRPEPALGARVIFLGPPGAGKGTQAARLAGAPRHPHASRPATCCARPSPPAPPLGRAGRAAHGEGRAGARRPARRDHRRAPAPARLRGRLHPRRLPAHAAARPRASSSMERGDATHRASFVLQRRGAARRAAAAALRPALVPALPGHVPRRQQPAQGRLALRQGRHAAHPARGRQGDGGGAAPGRVRRAHGAPHRVLPRARRASTRVERLPPARRRVRRPAVGIVEGGRRERPEVLGRAAEACTAPAPSWWRRWRSLAAGRGAGRDHEGARHASPASAS